MVRDSRERMVASAAALIGSRGVSATSFSEVLELSGAPRGSIYHHFPQGKRQLVHDALERTARQVREYQRSCTATTAAGVLDHFVGLFHRTLLASRCRAGCPVAGVVIDGDAYDAALNEVVRTSFRSWTTLLTRQLVAVGVPRRRAHALAITALASVEGALILCRAEGTLAPLRLVATELRRSASAT